MIYNKRAYQNAVNQSKSPIHWTLRDRGGVCVYWERARRFYLDAMARGDKQTAEAQAKSVQEYENVLGTLDAAEGGGI